MPKLLLANLSQRTKPQKPRKRLLAVEDDAVELVDGDSNDSDAVELVEEPQRVTAKRKTSVGAIKGVSANPLGPPKGRRLLSCIQDELDSIGSMDDSGNPITKRELVAQSFVRMASLGSFQHQKELLDREEGKVPDRVAGADGDALKLYIGMPLDGPDAP